MKSTQEKAIAFVVCIALCFSASMIGAIASFNAPVFYGELIKPPWAPPAFVFGPVWTFLYTLMSISLWLMWKQLSFKDGKSVYLIFLVQLALNGLWSWIFFKWNSGVGSFVEIIILIIFIILNIFTFWKRSKIAALLLMPYLLWVFFATYLTYTLWSLNPNTL